MSDDEKPPGHDARTWLGPPSRLTRISYAIVRGFIHGVALLFGRAQPFLQLRAQLRPRRFPVVRLGSFPLTPHLHARRPVFQAHGRAGLVDLLPTGPGATDKTFVDLRRARAQRAQPLVDLGW